MPPIVLETHQLADQQAEAALLKLPQVDPTTLVLLRSLQAQINALAARLDALEP